MKKLTLILFFLISCLNITYAIEFNWKLQQNKPHILLDSKGKNKTLAKGEIKVYNGKSKKYDRLVAKLQKGKIIFSQNNYTIVVEPKIKGNLLLVPGEIVNKSKEDLYLQVELSFTFPKNGKSYFFNGHETLAITKLPMKREGLKGRPQQKLAGVTQVFPVAGVVGENWTVFVGQLPHQLVSYHAAILDEATAKNYSLTFNQRHVISPNQTLNFNMVAGITATRYGKEEAMVQRMFDSFPELFGPVVGYDNPYIWGTEQYMESWSKIPNYELERRYHASLTWAFVPFKRAGDIYGHKNLWNYKPYRPFKWYYNSKIAGKAFDYRSLTYEKFHAQRKEIFHKYAKDFGYAFYNSASGIWCENQLALKHYPDSIVDDTDRVQKYIGPWCTPWDLHVRVFPFMTSFGDQFRKDMKAIYAQLGMPGFAFDCVTPGAYYRGPAVKKTDMPGKAWDEKGVFVDQTVAIIKLTDFVHKELPGAFIWLNGITGRGDTTMLEYGVFEDTFRSSMPVIRYNAGQIPMQTRGYGFARFLFDYLPDWRNMTKAEFTKELEKLSVHLVLNYFQYGLTGTYNTANGCSLEQYIMPELLEVRKLGWQAQVPLKVNTDKMFYSSRYGKGENSVIFMGNPYENSVLCKAEVGNDILGPHDYLWVQKMRDKAETVNKVQNKRSYFDVKLTSRVPILYESVCALSNLPTTGVVVKVASNKDINKIVYVLKFVGNEQFTTTLKTREIEGYKLDAIKVNGKIVNPAKLTVLPNCQINIEYNSKMFGFSKQQLMAFSFGKTKQEVDFEIVLPQNANNNELRQAQRIKGVFDFLVNKKALDKANIIITKGKKVSSKGVIYIKVNSNNKSWIELKGNCFYITAKDAKEADKLVRSFSYQLDKRFEYIFPFEPRAWDCLHPDILKHFNLNLDTLPLIRCFENK